MIDNLADIFRSEVLSNRQDLNDFTVGSVLYTLSRAVAASVNEVYTELDNLTNKGLILDRNIDDEVLTSLAPSLSRTEGTVASGSVLASNVGTSAVTLPPGTSLIDPVTELQFNITGTEDVTLNPLIETAIPVLASDIGVDYNLPAGRNLINVSFPRVSFTVGNFRDVDNTPKGSFSGGSSDEADEDYFERIKNKLLYDRVGQKQALLSFLLEQDSINSAFTELLAGGFLTIWISSSVTFTSTELTNLNTLVQDYIPIGTYSQIKQLVARSVTIRLFSFQEINLTTENLIIELVTNYVDTLAIGTVLSPSAIQNLVSERTGIVMKVLAPLEEVTLEEGEKFTVSKVEVTNEA